MDNKGSNLIDIKIDDNPARYLPMSKLLHTFWQRREPAHLADGLEQAMFRIFESRRSILHGTYKTTSNTDIFQSKQVGIRSEVDITGRRQRDADDAAADAISEIGEGVYLEKSETKSIAEWQSNARWRGIPLYAW